MTMSPEERKNTVLDLFLNDEDFRWEFASNGLESSVVGGRLGVRRQDPDTLEKMQQVLFDIAQECRRGTSQRPFMRGF